MLTIQHCLSYSEIEPPDVFKSELTINPKGSVDVPAAGRFYVFLFVAQTMTFLL